MVRLSLVVKDRLGRGFPTESGWIGKHAARGARHDLNRMGTRCEASSKATGGFASELCGR